MSFTDSFNIDNSDGSWWWLLALGLVMLAAFGVLLWWVLFADYKAGSTTSGSTTATGGSTTKTQTTASSVGSSTAKTNSQSPQSSQSSIAGSGSATTSSSPASPPPSSSTPTSAASSGAVSTSTNDAGTSRARVTSDQLDSIITKEFAGEDVVVHEPFGILYKSVPQKKDNLQDIKGVGPVLEKKLNEFGVFRFKQIANWPDAAIDEFQEQLSFPDRIRRDDWISQAISLAKGINPN